MLIIIWWMCFMCGTGGFSHSVRGSNLKLPQSWRDRVTGIFPLKGLENQFGTVGGAASPGSLSPGFCLRKACDASPDSSCLPAHPLLLPSSHPGPGVPASRPRPESPLCQQFPCLLCSPSKFSSPLSLKVFMKHHLPRDGYQALQPNL